jgi:hypothetical protein
MKFRAAVLIVVMAVPAVGLADEAGATAAYEKQDWASCAQQYGVLAAGASGDARAVHLYNAACCFARGGKVDQALEAVEQSLVLDPTAADGMRKDDDLKSLLKQARFVAAAKKADAALAAERKTQNVALATELMKLVDEDQAARNAVISTGAGPDSKAWAAMGASDLKTTARMKQVVAKYGWPGRKLVGKRAAKGAWLLVQHATQDQPFMEKCLALMKAAGDDVDQVDVAFLEDRLLRMQGKPQRYGTQFEGQGADMKPQPIEDPEHVDERRKALGMGTLAEAQQDIIRRYTPTAAPDAGR